jgi:outer membrane immunogenic protein
MSTPLTKAQPRAHPFVLAAFFLGAFMPLACGSITAAAADLPMKASPPPAPAVYSWTGCYVGANGGGGASSSNFVTTVGPGGHLIPADAAVVSADGTGSMNSSNFLGGGQAGCNFQSGTLVYGLEGDVDYFHSKTQFINPFDTLSDGVTPFAITQTVTTDFLATVRPRIGVAADRNFGYVTGGVAFTKASYTQNYLDALAPVGVGTATGSKFLTGWTAGAGWEYAFTDHWTFKAEYLFAAFPTTSALGAITDATPASNTLHGTADLIIQVVRAGANYKF